MMWLINFFKSLFDVIASLIDLVISLVKGLVDFISSLPTFISLISASFGHIPSLILPFVTITLTLSIIFIILGRSKSN